MENYPSRETAFEKFDPENYGLDPAFNLLNFAELKG